MNKKQREEFNREIEDKVKQLRKMKKVAEQVTLTEFIEQYPLHQHIILGAFWNSVNDDIDYSNISYGGTDPD